MMDMLVAIENSAVATWIRESTSLLAYTGILFCHSFGLALLVGLNAAVDLRLLGFASRVPVRPLASFFPLMWFGFWVNALSGVALLMASATDMFTNPLFYVKMAFVALAVTSIRALQTHVFDTSMPPDATTVPHGARRLASASLAFWTGAIVAGRLTAYPSYVASFFK
jgi:hypothetical protein